uniref:Uncharacterized protein n=1 Tax=Panagrolaimus davidi TaxID=227884 RepID=A0A914QEI0_9BILA
MNFFKLLLVFAFLLFGSFGQRFLRHSINDVALIDGKDSDSLLSSHVTSAQQVGGLLSSDGINAQQFGKDVKLTGFIVEIELELDELKFEYCSKRIARNRQRCMDQTVILCYDAENPPVALQKYLQDGCGPNKCRFEAGISPGLGNNLLWFMMSGHSTSFDYAEDICATATMMSPDAAVSFQTSFGSCKPLIIEGKIKLSVKKATPKCFLTVKNAKIWAPTTTQSPTTQASPASEAKGTKDEASNATLIWAIVGVILFILLIGIIAAGVWYFYIQKQKKTSEKKKIVVETPKHTTEADVVQEKTEEKKEPVKPKEETVEKKKATEEEKKPKAARKEKKPAAKIQSKPSKEVIQNDVTKKDPPKKVQAPAEPTLDDPTTGASITSQENEQPHVSVPKTVIHPAPLQPASKGITQYSRKGSLSGRHEIGNESFKRALDTESGMEEEPSQASITRPSKKNRKKKSGGGKKKHSKKRH